MIVDDLEVDGLECDFNSYNLKPVAHLSPFLMRTSLTNLPLGSSLENLFRVLTKKKKKEKTLFLTGPTSFFLVILFQFEKQDVLAHRHSETNSRELYLQPYVSHQPPIPN